MKGRGRPVRPAVLLSRDRAGVSAPLAGALPLLVPRAWFAGTGGPAGAAADRSTPPRRAFDAQRVRNRVAAFVYGNLTLLAAVLTSSSAMAADGQALALVAATALSTFVAHALSDAFSRRVSPDGEHPHGLRDELRDALPIATSAAVPLLLFCLDALGAVPAAVAQAMAAAVIVVRLAATGLVVDRLQGRRPTAAALMTGICLAAAGSALTVAKVTLTH